MLQRPSSLFWCHNVTSFSCLEISSVTLTPMSSPDSNLSAGLLTPPPAKPALSKPPSGACVPRPPVKHFSVYSFSVCGLGCWFQCFLVVFLQSLEVLPSDFKGQFTAPTNANTKFQQLLGVVGLVCSPCWHLFGAVLTSRKW